MQITKKIAVAALMLGAVACAKKTPSGKEFKIVESGNGVKPIENNVVEFKFSISDDKDSTLFENSMMGRGEYEMFVLPPDSVFKKAIAEGQQIDPIIEMLTMAHEGDSTQMSIVAKDFFGKMLPPFVKDSLDVVKVGLRISRVFDNREDYTQVKEAEMEAAAEAQKATDDKVITDFLTENKIEGVQKTESGLYYIITKEGKGENPTAGDNVKVHYTGTLLDGSKFDSSVDRGQPLPFVLGQGRVIKGWDEGIALLNKGAKATLYIPSGLAYGPRAMGAQIPANSVLKFDVELVDFTKAETPASK
ncbi:FKBP-type peptidyl-prolyl cis-trans isomerase [Flammeovirga yaeyamensis]|uniref:Peptidyl-prolyl cis-trans isomerase n=1 Tax=Flammeovirga yaeyamensis TaxID=367791 RepID=A0AAX1N478_9BACT|nr:MULTISPECIES: FKBP-type peptidyl-prolyl cis-trans isomerase [Flammeovirga]ANQ50333.1 FKBP-type peptidyl-prolyl cis-trans isomerase [Flammeovirga sp. MY04]MBB3699712.1 FKBP-type peptidyl-prolyl cis-trans isomerase [Flammeovirga yaeyamensis]NMF36718.1 FKBP-type peptidyl-prolyl cis-trans isomerase [Flammeovirga yaeyamensis]QWG02239.1 FKBP-type peptidyl-prolyl cis-trans isomerase [Flammeovirga yaeyamensis]